MGKETILPLSYEQANDPWGSLPLVKKATTTVLSLDALEQLTQRSANPMVALRRFRELNVARAVLAIGRVAVV